MPDVAEISPHASPETIAKPRTFVSRLKPILPSPLQCLGALLSAVMLVLAFPNFELWPLAWVALVPLLLTVSRNPRHWSSFLLGWLFGTVFFYGSCYWLSYSLIHTGRIPPLIAYLMLVPGGIVLGIFPALFALLLAQVVRKWGAFALLLSPIFWAALEFARLEITGQLWNAIAYSQAFHPNLIQLARWGGVYAVGFVIILVNSAVTLFFIKRSRNVLVVTGVTIAAVAFVTWASYRYTLGDERLRWASERYGETVVIAVQPNVPVDLMKSNDQLSVLTNRHFEASAAALSKVPDASVPRFVIWPESPMNFTYGTDSVLQQRLTEFAQTNHTSVLLNSQEVSPDNGIYNSAVLINERGERIAQYDKIRLLPFGEYVPLPQWFPGAGLIRGIVGDFTPGAKYPLMKVGRLKAGVFICIESAYPSIARTYAREEANVLINISNDGYLGPTPVLRQHLANAIFRAVENNRDVLRVTNSGITARIEPTGHVTDATQPFIEDVRVWHVIGNRQGSYYTDFGDFFVVCCSALSFVILVLLFRPKEQF
jgi:apolipoprotein N-acyltransferase